eukprot:m.369731 g.369731  ORF g.369731 m.369731 type:complete len:92 (-) comp16680_c1_seq8:649-924(-)
MEQNQTTGSHGSFTNLPLGSKSQRVSFVHFVQDTKKRTRGNVKRAQGGTTRTHNDKGRELWQPATDSGGASWRMSNTIPQGQVLIRQSIEA